MPGTLAELHNKLAPEIIGRIVEPLRRGGDETDVLILLESVVFGAVLCVTKLGGDDAVLDVVFERVKERLAKQRLGDIETSGSA